MTGDRIVYRSTRTGRFIKKSVAKRSKYLTTELIRGKKRYVVKGYRDKVILRKIKPKAYREPKRLRPTSPTAIPSAVFGEEEEEEEEDTESLEEEWQEDYEQEWRGLDRLDELYDFDEYEEWYEGE